VDGWQSAKGIAVAAAAFLLFLFAPLPREVVALTAAGVLMMSRKLHSHKMLGLVDWQLLVLFVGLFVVNHALDKTGVTAQAVGHLAALGVDLHQPGPLFVAAFVLSNVVSNVPAVMLLLPVATHELAGLLLALASTLAGNLLIVGSIANIIVVDAAARHPHRLEAPCPHRCSGDGCDARDFLAVSLVPYPLILPARCNFSRPRTLMSA